MLVGSHLLSRLVVHPWPGGARCSGGMNQCCPAQRRHGWQTLACTRTLSPGVATSRAGSDSVDATASRPPHEDNLSSLQRDIDGAVCAGGAGGSHRQGSTSMALDENLRRAVCSYLVCALVTVPCWSSRAGSKKGRMQRAGGKALKCVSPPCNGR